MEKQIFKEEQTNDITFEELCGDWNKTISRAGGFKKINELRCYGTDKNPKALGDYNCCIVGEAFSK